MGAEHDIAGDLRRRAEKASPLLEATDPTPQVIVLDIRPPHGPPPEAWILLYGALAVLFAVIGAFLLLDPLLARHLTFGGAFFFAMALPCLVYAGVLGTQTWQWRRGLRRHAKPAPGIRGAENTLDRYEHALRSAWKRIEYTRSRAPQVVEETLHFAWLHGALARAGLTRPRALVISPLSWRRRLPLMVPATLVEPEEIDATPGWFVLRHPVRLVWSALTALAPPTAALAAGWFLVDLVTSSQTGAAGATTVWKAVIGAVTCLGWATVSMVQRVRARGWAREILVAPSYIQIREGARVHRYTPDNTTLVVRPRRWLKHGIYVILCTKGVGADPPATGLNFFGFEDPGFLRVWRAWINPVRADRLSGADITKGGDK